MDKKCAVINSLRGQPYLILSGAIKQPTIRLANGDMMNCEGVVMTTRVFYYYYFSARRCLEWLEWLEIKNFSSHPANPKPPAKCFVFFPHTLLPTYADGALEKQLWAGQTLRLTVYHPPPPPSAAPAHHCLACTSQEWQQRVTPKGLAVQPPENVSGPTLTEYHTGRGEGMRQNNNLQVPRTPFFSPHTHAESPRTPDSSVLWRPIMWLQSYWH